MIAHLVQQIARRVIPPQKVAAIRHPERADEFQRLLAARSERKRTEVAWLKSVYALPACEPVRGNG